MKPKIAFFDIDGTLLRYKASELTENTRRALQCLRAQGVKLCLATGRAPFTVPAFRDVTFDAYITYNGSYCFDGNGVIFSNPLSRADVDAVIRNAAAIGRPAAVATIDRYAANGKDADLEEYYTFAKLTLEVAPDFEAVLEADIYQAFASCTVDQRPQLLKDAPGAKLAAWWERAVDIVPASGGKGIAVEKVLQHFGFAKEDAIAFGDGDNDKEMLMAVGTGVAMGNASDTLKSIATHVCPTAAEDGIYQFCLQQKLISI